MDESRKVKSSMICPKCFGSNSGACPLCLGTGVMGIPSLEKRTAPPESVAVPSQGRPALSINPPQQGPAPHGAETVAGEEPLPGIHPRFPNQPCMWCGSRSTRIDFPVFVGPASDAPPTAVHMWVVQVRGYCWECEASWHSQISIAVPSTALPQHCPITPHEYAILVAGNENRIPKRPRK